MPADEISNLDCHLGYWLRLVSNGVSQSFARRLEGEGVTVAEWVFLRVLGDLVSASPSRLAARMGMTKGAISKLAERLIAKGYVMRATDSADGRAQILSVTAAGMEKLPVLAAHADENDSVFFGGLSATEAGALMQLLRRIATDRGLVAPPID